MLPSALGGIVSIRQVNPTGPNTDTWYGYDRLGNVMLTVGATGTCVNSPGELWRLQDAHGNELADWTTGQWATAANAEGYGLTTKWYDGDVELNYFWQRWMEPGLSRFASRDALRPYTDPYTYVRGNPPCMVDPEGLDWLGLPEPWLDPNWIPPAPPPPPYWLPPRGTRPAPGYPGQYYYTGTDGGWCNCHAFVWSNVPTWLNDPQPIIDFLGRPAIPVGAADPGGPVVWPDGSDPDPFLDHSAFIIGRDRRGACVVRSKWGHLWVVEWPIDGTPYGRSGPAYDF